MHKHGLRFRLLIVAQTATLVSLGGCLARVAEGVDMVLAPAAYDNALRLPYTDLLPLAELLTRLWTG